MRPSPLVDEVVAHPNAYPFWMRELRDWLPHDTLHALSSAFIEVNFINFGLVVRMLYRRKLLDMGFNVDSLAVTKSFVTLKRMEDLNIETIRGVKEDASRMFYAFEGRDPEPVAKHLWEWWLEACAAPSLEPSSVGVPFKNRFMLPPWNDIVTDFKAIPSDTWRTLGDTENWAHGLGNGVLPAGQIVRGKARW